MKIPDRAYEIQPLADLVPRVREKARILIVCETDSDTGRLKTLLREADLDSESVNNMTSGCELARSDRFGVIFSTPFTGDGSWKRLIDVANQYNLSFEIVLLARTFDLNEWAEAMQVGAFDVFDVLCDFPKAAVTAQHALGAGYLKHFRTRAEQDTVSGDGCFAGPQSWLRERSGWLYPQPFLNEQ
jgi:DNA-binding NtrC family response regulator